MVTVYIGSTPIHHITLPEDATSYAGIEATYRQGGIGLTKYYDGTLPSGMTLDGKVVTLTMSQQETKLFVKGKGTLQLRVLTNDGLVLPSQKWDIYFEHSNSEEILE